jgi:hypothetical protein
MKDRDTKILGESYTNIYQESSHVKYEGDVEDIMFYSDIDLEKLKGWIKQDLHIETQYLAHGDDLSEMGMETHPEINTQFPFYVFPQPTDFTHHALVVKRRA